MKKQYIIHTETWSSVDDLGTRFRFNDYQMAESSVIGITAAIREAKQTKARLGARSCVVLRRPDGRGREVIIDSLTGRMRLC